MLAVNCLTIDTCRFCDNKLIEVINLGPNYPLAGGFMKNESDFENEKTYPLSLGFCDRCFVLQCQQVINSDILFCKGYFYYSSMIPMLVKHFDHYAQELATLVKDPAQYLVVEIGSNDGVFLRPLKKYGFRVIGVDPSDTVKQCIEDGFDIYNTYFNEGTAIDIVGQHGQCDIFLSSNSFAHINDMKSILRGMKILIKPDGLAIIEVHYSKSIIDELQFDFIYHEHMSYYTVSSINQIVRMYDMSLENCEFTKIHGSSIRIFLRNTAHLDLPDNVKDIIDNEYHLTQVSTYFDFSAKLYDWKIEMMRLIDEYQNRKIYGYGSSGRSNIICKFLDIKLDEVIDDAPSKIGNYMPIYHQCIRSSSILSDCPPDLLIILAWPYANDIIMKVRNLYQGPCLIPLPSIKLIDDQN